MKSQQDIERELTSCSIYEYVRRVKAAGGPRPWELPEMTLARTAAFELAASAAPSDNSAEQD